MTPEQQAAFITAQSACATAEIAAMTAANLQRSAGGFSLAYTEDDFAKIPERYGITHNAIMVFFQEY